jgi:hypothetical protein
MGMAIVILLAWSAMGCDWTAMPGDKAGTNARGDGDGVWNPPTDLPADEKHYGDPWNIAEDLGGALSAGRTGQGSSLY